MVQRVQVVCVQVVHAKMIHAQVAHKKRVHQEWWQRLRQRQPMAHNVTHVVVRKITLCLMELAWRNLVHIIHVRDNTIV